MNAEQFKQRTLTLAKNTIRLIEDLHSDPTAAVLARQLLRSATSVGANYRAACRARSRADFIAKMKIVEEECDETIYWLELFVETRKLSREKVAPILREADEILSMVVSSIKTARSGP